MSSTNGEVTPSSAPSTADSAASSNAASSGVLRPDIKGSLFRSNDSGAAGARAPRNGEPLDANDASSESATKRSGDEAFSAPIPASPAAAPASSASTERASKTSSPRNDTSLADASDSPAPNSSRSNAVRQSAGTTQGAGKNADSQRGDIQSRDAIAGSLSKSDARSKPGAQQNAASRIAPDVGGKESARQADASTNRRARLTIVPRQNASSARVIVQWNATSKGVDSVQFSPQTTVVWSGAVRRNRPVVVIVSVPRGAIGNKNRRVQVSLQVRQGTGARDTWKTVDSTTLVVSPR